MRDHLARYLARVTSARSPGVAWADLSEFGLAAAAFLFYFLVRGAVVDRAADAFQNARMIVDWQAALGLFVEPNLQAWALESEAAVLFFNFVYFWLDFPLIIAVGVVLFATSRRHYTLLRDACLISGGFALVVYWSFPVAPPRYFPEWGFVDTLQIYSSLSYQAQSTQPFVNPYAAVPSLHVGWAALLAVCVWMATGNAWARAGAALVFVLQSISVVVTGNHFLFDGLAGLLICAPAFAIALWLQRHGYPSLRSLLEQARERSGRSHDRGPPGHTERAGR